MTTIATYRSRNPMDRSEETEVELVPQGHGIVWKHHTPLNRQAQASSSQTASSNHASKIQPAPRLVQSTPNTSEPPGYLHTEGSPPPAPTRRPSAEPIATRSTPIPLQRTGPEIDILKVDAPAFIDDAPLNHEAVRHLLTPVRLPPAPGDMVGAVIEWWNPEHHRRADRVAAFRCLQKSEAPVQVRLKQIGFYDAPRSVKTALLRLRDRCDDADGVHFCQQLDQIQREMATGKTLAQVILSREANYLDRFDPPAERTASA